MTELLTRVEYQPFDYQQLSGLLKGFRYPRNKITKLLDAGEIIQLKRGLYILSELYGKSLVPEVAANLLYGPSYLSLEYVLAYYGLIPERVVNYTSVSSGRKKEYHTPIGCFSYQQLKPEYFALGYHVVSWNNSSVLMASSEKALCDKLYLSDPLQGRDAVENYLFSDLRIDPLAFNDLDTMALRQYAAVARNRNLNLLLERVDSNGH